ncbi:MAG: hypothetical protein AVDCRST_MAG93-5747, partial [uncultured Chloroflexia bacterium]
LFLPLSMETDTPVIVDRPDRGMVRQANALVKSAQTMELNEKRLIMLAMSRIRWGDEEFLTQDIPVTELAKWIGGNPYQEGRKAADGLLHRVVDILEDGGGQTKFQWTTLSAYIPAHKHKAGVACVRIRFNEELSPFLLQLRDRYNQIPLAHMLPMPSYNSQRLYEILWHDSHAGTKSFLSYEIEQLKIYIGLRDPKGKWEKYKPWKDFRKVLGKAVEDFNSFGSLKIKGYSGKRQSKRAYSHILFQLKKDDSPALPQRAAGAPDLDPKVMSLVAELERLGYVQNAFGAVETYGLEVVKRTLDLAREAERKAASTNKPIYNLGGLIASMLKQGTAARRVTTTQEEARLTNQELEKLARALADAYQEALTARANVLWTEMPEAERQTVHESMRAELSSTLVDYLNSVQWQGRGYVGVRNTYVLDTRLDALTEELADLEAYTFSDPRLTTYGTIERERVLERARSLHDNPTDT